MKFLALAAALHAAGVLGDGTGFIGLGKTLYNPTCAFACRNVIKGCKLLCTPEKSDANHGTAHSPVSTPPDCFVKDAAFLKTMAICLDTYCPISNKPDLALLEDYWSSHLGTGTLGNAKHVPALSYPDALAAARLDEERVRTNTTVTEDHSSHPNGTDHSSHLRKRQFMTEAGPEITSVLPTIKAGQPLNVTSFIAPKDWQKQYNGMLDFELNENGHSIYSLATLLVAILLPIPLSLLRFIPGVVTSRPWNALQSAVINPAVLGKRHREPAAGVVGLVPTRGQALYIFAISLLNVVFLVAPYVYHQPQSTFPSRASQQLSIIGNRAGAMAMGNTAGLFLFAARNNLLLWLTDWSYSTYLLLHRWLGYWAVLHTVLHSLMLWMYYRTYGNYDAELVRPYWIWGIVATAAVVALFSSSLLVFRQKLYEFFLASHVALSLVFLVGYYYHIWYVYTYSWGYEIWMFLAAGIWATDRLFRLARIALHGYRTAVVSLLPGTDGEYLRIDVEGTHLGEGVAYLTFPTLGRHFWESHPFSVAFNSSEVGEQDSPPASPSPNPSADGKEKEAAVVAAVSAAAVQPVPAKITTLFARVRTGATRKLAARAASGSVRLGVVVDGPYPHSGRVTTQLKQTSSIVYIAGGVGITALLPHLRHITDIPSQLFWGTRQAGLAASVQPALAALQRAGGSVEVETAVGQRLDLDEILQKALAGTGGGGGPLGIVVCGPPAMADHVRHKVTQLSRNGPATRPYVLVDEAFGW
ncbi:ferric reductase like transmembrane component-domain-containing protein [Lasiosphaeria hispida]|uniref:Ferric reductase like transmembrane component-domain-containing protein n=1 Tax=Lasiosphaeria hispida TaxID=260671 RepID=A0AAJ0MAA8_9PEZI|nr:ferric reductase like transmembrane component-domain-containing protein [Lasiosphaeria hispida]